MKNLFPLLISIFFLCYTNGEAQNNHHTFKKGMEHIYIEDMPDEPVQGYTQINTPTQKQDPKNPYLIPIGESANAFSFLKDGVTNVWLAPNLGVDGFITFIHRSNVGSPPAATSSGFLVYDYSSDGGETWQVNQGPIYLPDENNMDLYPNARYPQGVIYNPTGVLADAYITYIAPSIGCNTSTITSWCLNVHGTQALASVTSPVQGTFPDLPNDITRQVPDAFHINMSGNTFMIDLANPNGEPYNDSLTVRKGTFNVPNAIFDYTQSIEYFPSTDPNDIGGNDPSITNTRIGFSTMDPNIGYCLMMTHVDPLLTPHPYYQAVLIKTTDGGTTWSLDDPITVPLDDIPAFKYELLDDNDFANQWSPPLTPAEVPLYRDSVTYSMGFAVDLVVDADGNPHIIGTVHMANPGGTTPFAAATGPGRFGACHIYSLDGGVTWDGSIMENLNTFRGEWPTSSSTTTEDNRPQAGINLAGTTIAGTWLETDTATYGTTDNNFPDLHLTACDLEKGVYTSNIHTTSSLIPGEAICGTTSYYFWDYSNAIKIPIVYLQMTGATMSDPVQYMFIDSMMIDMTTDFNTRPVYPGIESIISPPSAACTYSSQEAVEIEIKNYGVTPLGNFDFSFVVDGKDTVTETVTTSIPAGSTGTYTFSGTADLSAPGKHYIRAFIQGVNHRDEFATSGSKFIVNLNGPAKPTLEVVQVQGFDLYLKSNITNTDYDYQWYEWDGSNSIEITNATDTIYTPVATGEYFVKLTGSDTCINYSDTTLFTYVQMEDATISSISSPTNGCLTGTPETISVVIDNEGNLEIPMGFELGYIFDGGTPVTELTDEVIPIGGSLNFSFDNNPINITAAGTYNIKVFVVSDDNSSNDTTSLDITLNEKPVTPTVTIAVTGTTLLSNATAGNQWYSGDGPEIGATSQSFTPSTPYKHPYYVIVTNSFGCKSDTSNKIWNIGINEHELNRMIEVFPNPVNDYVKISSNELEMESIQIFNMYGGLLLEETSKGNSAEINTANYPEGAYLIKIATSKGMAVKRFQVIR